MNATTNVREAAMALRRAQRAYMADRGNEALGKLVAATAEVLDIALAATEPSTGDVNRGRDALWNEFCPGIRTTDADLAHFFNGSRVVLDAVNYPALKAAGLRLYMAGRWSCNRPVNETQLWEDFRDALGLRPGAATKAGVHDDEPPLPFDRYAHRDGSRECRPVINDRPGAEL